MSFIKKTWLARIGVGLNRFRMNNSSDVVLESNPVSITQAGDQLSADNMNNLETRIGNAFDEMAGNLAPIEVSPATTNHTEGSQLIYNGILYKVMSAILIGDNLIVGTNISAYPMSSTFSDAIEDLEQQIQAIEGGITPKGDILSTNLPTADASNKGWQYYCTDLAKYAVSDGTQWVYFSNTMLTDIPDASDTGHALTNAKTTQMFNSVNGKIGQHDARIQNLEEKAGDYVEVQYRGTNAVPTGKASYGLVEKIVGKTRAWNQLVDFDNCSATNTRNGVTYTKNNDGTYTMSGTPSGNSEYRITPIIPFPAGHKVLVYPALIGSPANPNVRAYIWGNNAASSVGNFAIGNPNIFTVGSYANQNICVFYRVMPEETGVVNTKCSLIVRDITPIFSDWADADITTENIPLMVQQIPDLLKFDSYNAGSLVSTTVEGVEAVGVNIWDEETELGTIGSNGQNLASNSNLRSKNFIPIVGGQTLYRKCTYAGYHYFYDADKNYISGSETYDGANEHSIEVPLNASFMRFYLGSSYGTTYNHDIQICLNSNLDKAIYHPYQHSSISFPSVTLRSAGSVADEYDPQTGVITRKVGVIDLSTLTWSNYDTNAHITNGLQSLIKPSATDATVGNIVHASYEVIASSSSLSVESTKKTIAVNSVGTLIYTDGGSSETSPTGYLYYELATPTTETISPITNNTIYTEGGGTINTIQTQTPVIDNSLDVGYLAV